MGWSSPLPPMQPRDTRPDGERGFVSLRDHFAMAALTGILASAPEEYSAEILAEEAYAHADAMLKARE